MSRSLPILDEPRPADAATVRLTFPVAAPPDIVWAALRDFGALATRLAPGFVAQCRLAGTARHVTFANGTSAIEHLVGWDDEAMCLAYRIESPRIAWHLATTEIRARDGGTDFIWTTHVAPAELAPYIQAQMHLGGAAMTRALESAGALTDMPVQGCKSGQEN